MRDNDIVRVCSSMKSLQADARVKKRAGKLLVSKATKLHQNFDLILLTLINKTCVFEVDCEVEEFETLM